MSETPSGAGILAGLRLVEGSAFVAAPLGGMTLAQLGADVIRFDQIGGGLDNGRWPRAADGQSLFWAGLNKGKRSIQIDLRSDPGRELASALITAPDDGGGLFLTNFPARGWLAYERLQAIRPDLVMVALTGNPDGTSEVDYTVNPATGFPWATGPRNLAEPLNSLLPAWDVAMGTLAAVGLLAAERHRTRYRRRPARASGPLRRGLRDGRQPRTDRRGPARRPRPAARTATTSTEPSATTSRPATAGA